MGDDDVAVMLAAVGESIARVRSLAGDDPERPMRRVLAHLWSAYDELELERRDAHAARRR